MRVAQEHTILDVPHAPRSFKNVFVLTISRVFPVAREHSNKSSTTLLSLVGCRISVEWPPSFPMFHLSASQQGSSLWLDPSLHTYACAPSPHSVGSSHSSSSMACWRDPGFWPSTVQPTAKPRSLLWIHGSEGRL